MVHTHACIYTKQTKQQANRQTKNESKVLDSVHSSALERASPQSGSREHRVLAVTLLSAFYEAWNFMLENAVHAEDGHLRYLAKRTLHSHTQRVVPIQSASSINDLSYTVSSCPAWSLRGPFQNNKPGRQVFQHKGGLEATSFVVQVWNAPTGSSVEGKHSPVAPTVISGCLVLSRL